MTDFPAQHVLARLGWGRDHRITIGKLQEALGWSRRPVEEAIQALRLDGKPVASGTDGVWLGDAADIEACLHSLRARIANQKETASALEKTLVRMRGAGEQTTLFGEAGRAA